MLRKDHDCFVRAKTKSTENISKPEQKQKYLLQVATSFCHPNHLNDFDVTTLYNFSVQKLVLWTSGCQAFLARAYTSDSNEVMERIMACFADMNSSWPLNRPNEWLIDQFVMEFATQNGDPSAEHFEHASNPMWETATAAVCQHGQTSLRLARHTMVSGRTKIWPKLPPGRCLTKFTVCKLDFSRDNF